ncbi:MAG: cupin domain-containing protein [Candidatus Aenigmarchaeota archaeon]|nr:cupin domain-containing protein [Candidatus Aenigmarchaeota archaeon]
MGIEVRSSVDGTKTYSVGDITVGRLYEFEGQCWEHVFLGPGPYRPAFHTDSDEVLYVVEGCGCMTINGMRMDYFPGKELYLPAGTSHGFEPRSRTHLFSVQTPPIVDLETGEADIHYE